MTPAQYKQLIRKPRRSKYNARKVRDDGFVFDSMREHREYCSLKLMKKDGLISDLEVHPEFPLRVHGILVATYEADFKFFWILGKVWKIIDVKGVSTPVFKLKKRLFDAIYPDLNLEIVK